MSSSTTQPGAKRDTPTDTPQSTAQYHTPSGAREFNNPDVDGDITASPSTFKARLSRGAKSFSGRNATENKEDTPFPSFQFALAPVAVYGANNDSHCINVTLPIYVAHVPQRTICGSICPHMVPPFESGCGKLSLGPPTCAALCGVPLPLGLACSLCPACGNGDDLFHFQTLPAAFPEEYDSVDFDPAAVRRNGVGNLRCCSDASCYGCCSNAGSCSSCDTRTANCFNSCITNLNLRAVSTAASSTMEAVTNGGKAALKIGALVNDNPAPMGLAAAPAALTGFVRTLQLHGGKRYGETGEKVSDSCFGQTTKFVTCDDLNGCCCGNCVNLGISRNVCDAKSIVTTCLPSYLGGLSCGAAFTVGSFMFGCTPLIAVCTPVGCCAAYFKIRVATNPDNQLLQVALGLDERRAQHQYLSKGCDYLADGVNTACTYVMSLTAYSCSICCTPSTVYRSSRIVDGVASGVGMGLGAVHNPHVHQGLVKNIPKIFGCFDRCCGCSSCLIKYSPHIAAAGAAGGVSLGNRTDDIRALDAKINGRPQGINHWLETTFTKREREEYDFHCGEVARGRASKLFCPCCRDKVDVDHTPLVDGVYGAATVSTPNSTPSSEPVYATAPPAMPPAAAASSVVDMNDHSTSSAQVAGDAKQTAATTRPASSATTSTQPASSGCFSFLCSFFNGSQSAASVANVSVTPRDRRAHSVAKSQ